MFPRLNTDNKSRMTDPGIIVQEELMTERSVFSN